MPWLRVPSLLGGPFFLSFFLSFFLFLFLDSLTLIFWDILFLVHHLPSTSQRSSTPHTIENRDTFLPGFTGFYLDYLVFFLGFTKFYLVLPDFIGFLLGFTGFYRIFTEFYVALRGFT